MASRCSVLLVGYGLNRLGGSGVCVSLDVIVCWRVQCVIADVSTLSAQPPVRSHRITHILLSLAIFSRPGATRFCLSSLSITHIELGRNVAP